MKISTKISALLATFSVAMITLLFGLTTTANADCLYQYNSNGFNTSATPVFNSICGVPQNIGDESNFVRIRQNSNGDDTDNINNPQYTIGTLDSACDSGTKYDLWNYVHNDASQNDNPDVGDGSAVAKDVAIKMTAPLGTTNSTFDFGATISASNAASVSDSATLNCGTNQVELSLVPGTVHIFSVPYGTTWQNLPDSTINSTLPLGSTNAGLSSMGGGQQWGCWTYRIVVVYQVTVTKIPPVSTPPTCNYITADEADIESVNYTANSATGIGFTYNLYSGSGTGGTLIATANSTTNGHTFSNTLEEGKTYTVEAIVTSSNYSGVTAADCAKTFTTSTPTPPPTPTPENYYSNYTN